MAFGIFVLLIALAISAIAAYYSIVGLAAIFAAAILPIVIMASALEVAKITATVWLHQYWHRCRFLMKAYLVTAVIVLMFITSLGIYGFLSKAHIEQSLVAGDNTVQISEIDRRIDIERKRISDTELVVAQLDQAVQVLMDAQRVRGAEGAISVRQSQAAEREQLNTIIDDSNRRILDFQALRVPLLQEQLTIESKVGPLKYIAALIYGDELDASILEKSVRIVILLLVFVFDPLAIMLVLAGVESISWAKERKLAKLAADKQKKQLEDDAQKWRDEEAFRQEQVESTEEQDLVDEFVSSQETLGEEFSSIIENNRWYLYERTEETTLPDPEPDEAMLGRVDAVDEALRPEEPPSYLDLGVTLSPPFKDYAFFEPEEHSIIDPEKPVEIKANTVELHPINGEYFRIGNKTYHQRMLPSLRADLRASVTDHNDDDVRFGTKFPATGVKGELFLRVDYQPTKLFKFNGDKWIEVDKLKTDLYTYNESYIQMLVSKISNGEYDPELLTDAERDKIESYLRKGDPEE